MPTDEDDQDGHFFYNHPERGGLLRCLGARSHFYCCLGQIPTEGGQEKEICALRSVTWHLARATCRPRSLIGDDETAHLPSPVSMLSPLAASKRPAGALSPTDVALFPTFPCTAEGCLKEASHTPYTLPPGE